MALTQRTPNASCGAGRSRTGASTRHVLYRRASSARAGKALAAL